MSSRRLPLRFSGYEVSHQIDQDGLVQINVDFDYAVPDHGDSIDGKEYDAARQKAEKLIKRIKTTLGDQYAMGEIDEDVFSWNCLMKSKDAKAMLVQPSQEGLVLLPDVEKHVLAASMEAFKAEGLLPSAAKVDEKYGLRCEAAKPRRSCAPRPVRGRIDHCHRKDEPPSR